MSATTPPPMPAPVPIGPRASNVAGATTTARVRPGRRTKNRPSDHAARIPPISSSATGSSPWPTGRPLRRLLGRRTARGDGVGPEADSVAVLVLPIRSEQLGHLDRVALHDALGLAHHLDRPNLGLDLSRNEHRQMHGVHGLARLSIGLDLAGLPALEGGLVACSDDRQLLGP